MYKQEQQLKLEDFVFPYGQLDEENEWVRMAQQMPWEAIEEKYAKLFVNNGHPAHPARLAVGSLIVKKRLRCSDEWVVRHVSENPYIQYFLGLREYGNRCPFGESTLVAFRKRIDEKMLCEINDMLLATAQEEDCSDNDGGKGGDGGNRGTLLLDATCTPADVSYPQDLKLLNEGRGKADGIIDELQKSFPLAKRPRTYRKKARREYLRTAKKKKKSALELRRAIRGQLQYLYRNLNAVYEYVRQGAKLTTAQHEQLNVLSLLYEQQKRMHDSRTHSVPDRIVSLSQPWIRPIVRGKAGKSTEFGAKLHTSVEQGLVRIERLDFDAYNEAVDLPAIVERYQKRTGHFPQEILADKLYRTRDNYRFCKHHGIRLAGPPLGRPRKDANRDKHQEYIDSCARNEVEGVFGAGKRAYGLGLIMEKLEVTTRSAIASSILTINLVKLRCARFRFLFLQRAFLLRFTVFA